MSPTRRPGDADWKPSQEDVAAAQYHEPGLVLRVAAVIPFMVGGAIGAVAFVAWVAVLVIGLGTGSGPAWKRAQGQPAGEVALQVLLLLLIGVVCVAIVGLSVYATTCGLRTHQPRLFWLVAQGFFAALGFLLIAGRSVAPGTMKDIGLTGGQWLFAFAMVAASMIVVGMRMRGRGDDETDGEEDGGG